MPKVAGKKYPYTAKGKADAKKAAAKPGAKKAAPKGFVPFGKKADKDAPDDKKAGDKPMPPWLKKKK